MVETVSSYLIEIIGQARRLFTEGLGMAVYKHLSGKSIGQQGCPGAVRGFANLSGEHGSGIWELGKVNLHVGWNFIAPCPNILAEMIDLEICAVQ